MPRSASRLVETFAVLRAPSDARRPLQVGGGDRPAPGARSGRISAQPAPASAAAVAFAACMGHDPKSPVPGAREVDDAAERGQPLESRMPTLTLPQGRRTVETLGPRSGSCSRATRSGGNTPS